MQYSKSFFANRRALTTASAEKILGILWQHLQPNSVLDIGCATGIWLAKCKLMGADKVFGLDGPWVPKEKLEINSSEFAEHKLENITLNVDEFDLALCIELAEHLPEDSGRALIKFLTSHANTVLFSAAVPGQGGTGHVNEQVQSYWREKFAEENFDCFDIIRPSIWTDDVNVIYKQNMLLYVRKDSNPFNILIQNHIPKISSNYEVDRIHPDLFSMRSNAKPSKKNTLADIFSKIPRF